MTRPSRAGVARRCRYLRPCLGPVERAGRRLCRYGLWDEEKAMKEMNPNLLTAVRLDRTL